MAVVKLELGKEAFAKGRSFGETGPYEQLWGTVHFATDPGNPLNQVITDLELAPCGRERRVHSSADF